MKKHLLTLLFLPALALSLTTFDFTVPQTALLNGPYTHSPKTGLYLERDSPEFA
jgi:hypothetical protein